MFLIKVWCEVAPAGTLVLIRAPGHSPNAIWTDHFSVDGLEVG